MYRYDDVGQRRVEARAAQFRDQTQRYLAGELSEDEFRPLRLQNGLYMLRQAPMLRVAIPYGVVSSLQLRRLARIARIRALGDVHFTTRQNVQFNGPALQDVPDILAELAEVQLHPIQTSGSCIRSITSDALADDERVDPRPWCEILRQWSPSTPNSPSYHVSSKLPSMGRARIVHGFWPTTWGWIWSEMPGLTSASACSLVAGSGARRCSPRNSPALSPGGTS